MGSSPSVATRRDLEGPSLADLVPQTCGRVAKQMISGLLAIEDDALVRIACDAQEPVRLNLTFIATSACDAPVACAGTVDFFSD